MQQGSWGARGIVGDRCYLVAKWYPPGSLFPLVPALIVINPRSYESLTGSKRDPPVTALVASLICKNSILINEGAGRGWFQQGWNA